MTSSLKKFQTGGDRTTWPGHTGNWRRWDNNRGALNLIDTDAVLRAATSVSQGRSFACGRPVQDSTGSNIWGTPAFVHEMLTPPGNYNAGLLTQVSHDRMTFITHGLINTHIDALGHMGHGGVCFDGNDYDEVVTMDRGVLGIDVTECAPLTTRGVIIDVPRMRGVPRLQPDDVVGEADIERLATSIVSGDAVIIRTGVDWREAQRTRQAPVGEEIDRGNWPGLNCAAIDLLASLDISVVATDTPGDSFPHEYEEFTHAPVHTLAEVYYGIPMLHNLELEEVSQAAADAGQTYCLLCVAPLNVPGATGSLIAPTVVL